MSHVEFNDDAPPVPANVAIEQAAAAGHAPPTKGGKAVKIDDGKSSIPMAAFNLSNAVCSGLQCV
jgi:hypothetical protein